MIDTEFFDTDFLQSKSIKLVLHYIAPANPEKMHVPAYHFYICDLYGRRIGECDLRIGHNDRLYYGGNIGYTVYKQFRGHHYAGKACKLLFKLAKKHELGYVIITCNPENKASYRTAKYAGCKYLGTVEIPSDNDMRIDSGETHKCIFKYNL